jgi:hypothetical protein
MNANVVSFLERHGMKMEWSCRRSFLAWFLTPFFAVGILLLMLSVKNPQSSRFVYIFQSMVLTHGESSNPWGDSGPMPPTHYTGVWYRWHSNGRLSFEEHYADGKLDGPFRAWDRAGRQWLETAYRSGRYHGDYILFYDNGATNRVGHYFDDKKTGHWLHFYPDGKKWSESFFSDRGVFDGQQTAWNTNGAVVFTQTWHKGEPWDGRFTLQRGTNWFRDQYESGKLISTTNLGPIVAYFPVAPPATNQPGK